MALINQPPTNQIADKDGFSTAGWAPVFSTIIRILQALTLSGTTAQRPTAFIWIGRPYFDSTLGLPVYVKSFTSATGVVSWVKADGTGA